MSCRRFASASILSAITILVLVSSGLCSPIPYISESSLLTDPSGNLTIEDVSNPGYGAKFTPIKLPGSLGTDQTAHWLRFTIEFPPGTKEESWVLDLNWDYLRSLDLYAPQLTSSSPFISGDWKTYIDSALPLPAPQGNELVCYVRIAGYGGLSVNPMIVSESGMIDFNLLKSRLLWMFFGLLLTMFVYNAFLYFTLLDNSYLWYVLHILFVSYYYLFFNGLAPSMSGKTLEGSFYLNLHLSIANFGVMLVSIGLFTKTFLMTKKNSPILDKILVFQIFLCLIYMVSTFFMSPDTAFGLGPIPAFTTTFVVLICSIGRLIQGFKPAFLFVPGWLVYVGCGLLHSFTWAGVFSATPLTIYAPEFGTALEVLVMSLALAYRIRILREEKTKVEWENQRLAEKNALFTIILDYSKLGIGLVKDGAFSWANKQLQTMIGKNDRLNGVRLDELPGLKELLENSDSESSDKGFMKEGQIVIRGNPKDVRALGQTVDNPFSEAGTVWVFEDISEQKRLEQLKEDFDQIMRHDLKSPLATISSLQSAIENVGQLNEKQKGLCTLIGETASNGLNSLNMLLDLYQLEAGKFKPVFSKVDLLRAIADAISELTPYLQGGLRSVQVSAQEGLDCGFCVQGDQHLIHTVLVNLIKNALEAIPSGGNVTVSLEEKEADLCVRITNPGEVPPEIRDSFFEKFVTSGKQRGSGIGTYSARLIARAFGGDVVLDTSNSGFTNVTACFKKT